MFARVANTGQPGEHTFYLYVREKDTQAELWEGARSGTQAAMDVFNADEVYIPSDTRLVTWAG